MDSIILFCLTFTSRSLSSQIYFKEQRIIIQSGYKENNRWFSRETSTPKVQARSSTPTGWPRFDGSTFRRVYRSGRWPFRTRSSMTRVHLTRTGGLIRRSSVSIAVDAPNLEFTSTVTLMYADYSTRSDGKVQPIVIKLPLTCFSAGYDRNQLYISWKIINNKLLCCPFKCMMFIPLVILFLLRKFSTGFHSIFK